MERLHNISANADISDNQVKFFYKHEFLGSCDPEYMECDKLYDLIKSDSRAATQVLHYMNSLGDPVFPTEDGGYEPETDVSKVDIDDLYYWFMRELEYQYQDDMSMGFGFLVDADFQPWDFEIFDGPVADGVFTSTIIKASRYDNVPGYKAPNGGYLYIFKHGIGPGTMPSDVEIIKTKDLPNYYTAVWLSDFLTADELKQYDIPSETEINRYLDRIGYCQKNGDVVPCDEVSACDTVTASTNRHPKVPNGWNVVPECDDDDGNWGTISKEMPNNDGYYWINVDEDDNGKRCFSIEYAYRNPNGSVGKIWSVSKVFYRLGDAVKEVDRRINIDLDDVDACDKVTSSTKYMANMVSASSSDSRYDENDELYKYYVAGYFDSNLRGLEDNLATHDFDEALDFAHKLASNGDYVEITNEITGKSHTYSPDEWMEAIEFGEVPSSTKDLY